MSKRILAFLLTVGLLATSSAFASRARNTVMGAGDPTGILTRGSFYYDDMNNVFYNPSYANDFKNWAIVEKANGAGAAADAEGGFMGSFSNFNVGLYLNRESGLVGGAAGGAAYSNAANMRPVDLIIASDMGFKWGVGLSHSSNKASATVEDTETALRLGAQVMDFEPFITFLIKGTGKVAAGDNKFKHTTAGLRYKWGEWVPYTAYREDSTTAAGATTEVKTKDWGLGIGRNTKLADGVNMNYGVGYWRTSNAGAAGGANRFVVPVDMSVEGELTSWLTGRAGLSYNLADQTNGLTTADATTGRVGATFHMGKADLDWAVGHVAQTNAAAAEDVDGGSFGFDTGFFTAASLTYRW